MILFLAGIVGALGLTAGSFLNVLLWRTERKKNWWLGRSFCDHCERKLFWWENVPVVSFFLLRGRCHTCRSPISCWYPTVEASFGILFLITFFYWQKVSASFFILVVYLLIIFFLAFILIFDFRNQIIPDEAILLLLFLSFIAGERHLLTGLLASFFLLVLHLVTRGKGMGLGDVKFAFFIGLFLGWSKVILALYLAFLTGGIISVIMILLKKASLKKKVAFGPFLVLGTIVSWWWGEQIIFFVKEWLNF